MGSKSSKTIAHAEHYNGETRVCVVYEPVSDSFVFPEGFDSESVADNFHSFFPDEEWQRILAGFREEISKVSKENGRNIKLAVLRGIRAKNFGYSFRVSELKANRLKLTVIFRKSLRDAKEDSLKRLLTRTLEEIPTGSSTSSLSSSTSSPTSSSSSCDAHEVSEVKRFRLNVPDLGCVPVDRHPARANTSSSAV